MWCVYVMICLRIKKWELGLAFRYDQTFMSMVAPLMLRWADGGALELQDFSVVEEDIKRELKIKVRFTSFFLTLLFSCDCLIH